LILLAVKQLPQSERLAQLGQVEAQRELPEQLVNQAQPVLAQVEPRVQQVWLVQLVLKAQRV
jgi:hypothetical protein